ncbi:hypothetical protein [Colwellia maritima]|uniref:hypothetical protein n=1 Tax=Colwellia maritima TaxID=2912588 RepID=UPI0030843B9C
MPDYGTARCDFPGGSAEQLYHSIQKILALPDSTRIFLGHDYKSDEREVFAWESSVAEQKSKNIHLVENVTSQDYVQFRNERDAHLPMPKLIIPSVQVNIRAGHFPKAESNGISYLKLPINTLK